MLLQGMSSARHWVKRSLYSNETMHKVSQSTQPAGRDMQIDDNHCNQCCDVKPQCGALWGAEEGPQLGGILVKAS